MLILRMIQKHFDFVSLPVRQCIVLYLVDPPPHERSKPDLRRVRLNGLEARMNLRSPT